MSDEPWVALWPLPNLNLVESFACRDAGMLAMNDTRLAAEPEQRDDIAKLLGSFKNEFGVRIQPGVMAYRKGAQGKVASIEAMSAFRDIICIAALTQSHAHFVRGGHNFRIHFSDAFDFYPWYLGKNSPPNDIVKIVADTPAMLGIHSLAKLHPQGAPAISRRELSADECDRPLLAALISAWEREFSQGLGGAAERRLFRSLDMARSALRMPGGADASVFHVGRSIALWVSAFEILAHDGWSSPKRVVEMMSRANLRSEALAKREYAVSFGREIAQVGLCGAIYMKVHAARNDFLHGNEITDEALRFVPGGHNLVHYCAPLYRIALTASLNLEYPEPAPAAEEGVEDMVRWASASIEFDRPQREIERALLAALEPAAKSESDEEDEAEGGPGREPEDD